MKKYYDYFIKNKLFMFSLTALYFMIMVIIYNVFCYTTGLSDLTLNVSNFKKIFILECISYFTITYLCNVSTLWFMEKRKNFKEIAIISVPMSLLVFIINSLGGIVVANIFMFSFYFLYRYMKDTRMMTIVSTFGYLVILAIVQTIFYYLKYYILGIHYEEVDNYLLRFLLSIDFYLFIFCLIGIKVGRK